MNLGQMRDAVYDFLQEDATNNHISPSEIDRYCNEGMHKVHAIAAEQFEGFFRTDTTLSEVVDVSFIALPNDLLRISRLERLKGNHLPTTLRTPYTIPRLTDSYFEIDRARGGLDVFWGARNSNVGYIQHGQARIEMVPAPSATTADSLKLHYVYRPATMAQDTHVPFLQAAGAGSGTLAILEEYHDLIWKWALMYAISKEGDSTQMQLVNRMYQERLDDMKKYLDRMNEQEPRYVNAADDMDFFEY